MRSGRTIWVPAASVIMMLMLAWLTVSAPFVNASLKQKAKLEKKMTSTSPLAGSEEEKVPTSPSPNTTNEYLHESGELQHSFTAVVTAYTSHQYSVYFAFHGELVSPPPEA
jgi:hypothetical protein